MKYSIAFDDRLYPIIAHNIIPDLVVDSGDTGNLQASRRKGNLWG
jgi:hypothetical protein